jgi:hypothetical protein
MGEQKYIRKNKKDYSTYEKYEELYDGKIATFGKYGTKEVVGENITPNGVFLDMPEGGIEGNYDTSIDEEGNIYILDIYNGRIQEFDKNGKHSRNIPIKNVYKKSIKKVNEQIAGNEYREKEEWVVEDLKNEIAATNGKIYVRNGMKNNIEQIDENGNVKETTNIPDKIDGKNTREMRMWADEGGVGLGKNGGFLNNGKVDNGQTQVVVKQINNKSIEVKIGKNKLVICQNSATASEIEKLYIDEKGDVYLYMFASKGTENGIAKVSENGRLMAVIKEGKYLFGNDGKDACGNKPTPLLLNWEQSMKFDPNGNLYFLESVCCGKESQTKCFNKIKIIKLANSK